ncbi:hypothetical protein RRG08_014067 [Elysia crispata]|uniref:Uncharacterized protein n=1 Tax=Elysia crispata TaxID=231223 RepID=A0AAE1DQF0_9GAST|nr:hypothetical protein RRG08_014067 [Elysia crispata]
MLRRILEKVQGLESLFCDLDLVTATLRSVELAPVVIVCAQRCLQGLFFRELSECPNGRSLVQWRSAEPAADRITRFRLAGRKGYPRRRKGLQLEAYDFPTGLFQTGQREADSSMEVGGAITGYTDI